MHNYAYIYIDLFILLTSQSPTKIPKDSPKTGLPGPGFACPVL